ncbi:MAG: hypothetical protein WCJ61_16735 [Paludibacter sp.]
MKKLRTIVTILFLSLIMGGTTSCLVRSHTDNGRHRGIFQKHDNNRHRKGAVIIFNDNERGHRPNQNDDRD